MEGILKQVPVESTPAEEVQKTDGEAIGEEMLFKNVPYYIYQHFGKEPTKTDDKTATEFRDIYKEVLADIPEGYKTPGNVLMKLASLQRRLGAGGFMDSPHRKVHSWLVLSKNIKDMKKQQEALRR